jgi:hypothetical protein
VLTSCSFSYSITLDTLTFLLPKPEKAGRLAKYMSVMPYKKMAGVEFEVLTAVVVKVSVFWDIIKCSLLKVNRRLGQICRLHLQGRRISQVSCYILHAGFLLGLHFDPEEGGIFL